MTLSKLATKEICKLTTVKINGTFWTRGSTTVPTGWLCFLYKLIAAVLPLFLQKRNSGWISWGGPSGWRQLQNNWSFSDQRNENGSLVPTDYTTVTIWLWGPPMSNGATAPGGKIPGREANHLPAFSAIPPRPTYILITWSLVLQAVLLYIW
jgi:hypothetical protein